MARLRLREYSSIMRIRFLPGICIALMLCGSALAQNFWQPSVGPYEGAVHDCVETSGGTVFVASQNGGVFKSTDGVTFTAANTGLPTTTVRCLALNAAGDLFCGTGAGVTATNDGVYKLTGATGSWAAVSSLQNAKITAMTRNPVNGDILAITGTSLRRMAGGSGSFVTTGAVTGTPTLRGIAVRADGIIFLTSDSGVFYSTDTIGSGWTACGSLGANNLPRSIAINSSGVIAVGLVQDLFNTNIGGLVASSDGGATWSPVALSGSAFLALTIDSGGRFIAGGSNIHTAAGIAAYSTNGTAWTVFSSGLGSMAGVIFAKQTTHGLYLGANGAWRTTDNGANWSQLTSTSGLQPRASLQQQSLVFTGNGDLYAGLFSDGVSRLAGGTWSRVNSGLTTSKAATALGLNGSGEVLFGGGNVPGNSARLTGNGSTWTVATMTPSPINAQINGFITTNNGTLLAGAYFSGGSYGSTTGGSSYTQVAAQGSTAANSGIWSYAKDSAGNVFMATETSGVLESFAADNGANVVGIGPTQANYSNNTRAVIVNALGQVLCARQNNTTGACIHRYTGSGGVWVDSSGGITGFSTVFCFALASNGDLFCGSDHGLFKSTDNGATWTAYQTGLAANSSVASLAIGADGYLYAGLNIGGGVWKSVNPVSAATAGTLQFSSAAYSVNENGASVTLTVTRTNGSSSAVGVSFATANGSATAGSDYTNTSGTLSWANGDTAGKTITVPILDDSVFEGDETFTVALSSVSGGAALGTNATATVTIVDNDPPLTVIGGTYSVSGSTVTITANPPPAGQTFDAWTGATVANANYPVTTYTATAGTTPTVTATYKYLPPVPPGAPTTFSSRGAGGGGAMFSPTINPFNTSELWTSCDMSELFRSTTFGQSWTSADFRSIQGNRSSEVQFTSNAGILFCIDNSPVAGVDMARPSKSIDGGATWHLLANDPTGGGAIKLIADGASTTRLIISDYSHVWFSNDGGATWNLRYTAATGQGVHVAGAFFDSNPNNIYIGTNDGVLVSTNAGGIFTLTTISGLPSGKVIGGFAAANNGSITRFIVTVWSSADIYAGLLVESAYQTSGSYGGVFMCNFTIGGPNTWATRSTGVAASDTPFFVRMTAGNISNAYLAGRDSSTAFPVVYKTTTGGVSWSAVFNTANNANIATGWQGYHGDREWYFGELAMGFTIAATDVNRLVITDFGFVHVSTDGGATWTQCYVQPADQNAAGAATPTGRSYHSNGLENTTNWSMAFCDPNHLFVGDTDISGLISSDGGLSFGFGYTGHSLNTMYRCVNSTASATTLYAATSSIHDMYYDTHIQDQFIDPSANLTTAGLVLVSANSGATWTTLHDFSLPVVWVATDPTHANRLYACVANSTSGGIYVSNDINNGAASTWTKLPNPPRTQGHPWNLHVLADGTLVAAFSARVLNGTSTFTASSGVFVSTDNGQTWADRSDAGMLYWTKDVVIDPHDATQSTWFACVWGGYGGLANGLGGLYRTTDRGLHWTRIFSGTDRVESCTINPTAPGEIYVTTEYDGLWYGANANAATPAFTQLAAYPFRNPERVFFNPFKPDELWITSFGNALRVGTIPSHGTLRFSAMNASLSESAGSATITVTRTGGSTGAITVNYATGNVTATAGADYTATSGTLLWIDTDGAVKTFSIPITNDTLAEGNETLILTLSAPGGGASLGAPATMTLTILDPLIDAWRFAKFGANANVANIAGDLANPAGDGIVNLLKYALGLNPLAVSPSGLPSLGTSNGYLTLTFSRPLTATDVSYTVQVSSDLVTWNDGSLYTAGGDVPTNAFTTQLSRTVSGGIETITVRDNTAMLGAGARFIRLKVIRL